MRRRGRLGLPSLQVPRGKEPVIHCMRGAYRIGSPLKLVSSMRVSYYCTFLSLFLFGYGDLGPTRSEILAPATDGRPVQKVNVRGDITLTLILHAWGMRLIVMKPLYFIMQFCVLPKICMFKLIQSLKISCRGSQESNTQLRQTEAKRPLCIRRQRARRRRHHIRANIIIAIPLRRSQHRQRRRSPTAHALKGDIKAHLLGRVIHSRFHIVRASRIVFTSDPVGRAESVAAGRRKRRCEGTVAEELEDFVRGAAKGLALVCCEGD